jgi:hypothetical protein
MTDLEFTDLVRQLCGDDEDGRENAFGILHVRIVNQGTLTPPAAGVVEALLAELESKGSLSSQAWNLLQLVYDGSSYGETVDVDGVPVDIEETVRPRILASLPLIEDALADIEPDELAGLSWLLMSLVEQSFEVIEMLEREVAAASAERRDALAGALRDAREAWTEAKRGLVSDDA